MPAEARATASSRIVTPSDIGFDDFPILLVETKRRELWRRAHHSLLPARDARARRRADMPAVARHCRHRRSPFRPDRRSRARRDMPTPAATPAWRELASFRRPHSELGRRDSHACAPPRCIKSYQHGLSPGKRAATEVRAAHGLRPMRCRYFECARAPHVARRFRCRFRASLIRSSILSRCTITTPA